MVVAGLSAYTYSVTSSLSQHNSSLSTEVSTLNQEASILAVLETNLGHKEAQTAINYLAANYNRNVGLIPETPHSNRFWLYSDNYLAVLALRQAGSSNSTLMAIAQNISTTLARYARNTGNAMNQYMALGGDWKGSCSFNSADNYTIPYTGNATIMTTLNNGTGILSPSQYADIAFLEGICYTNQNNYVGWSQGYKQGSSFFNGVGFNDTAFREGSSKGVYQTFKLALSIYADGSQCGPINETGYGMALATLLQMQAPDGGFYTGYNSNLSANGTTNVETTSLAILALTERNLCFH
jgi:hypothetical protein